MSARRVPLALLAAVVVAAGVLGVDSIAEPATPPAPATGTTAAATPLAGASVCAVGASSDTSATTVAIAAADLARSQPASYELEVLDEGTATRAPVSQLFPGAAARATPEVGDLGAAVVRWREAPATVSREWRIEGDDDLPDVTIAGPCPTSTSGRFLVPGLSTSGGDEAVLRLVNPYRSAATLAIGFLGPEGPESPLALRNVSVPGRSVREVTVNEFLPERGDLAAVVEVVTGRLVVEGMQLSRSAIGDVDGGSLLAAAPAPAEEWTVPFVRDDAATTSWLWVANPSQRAAEVELSLHTPDGGVVPEGLATTTVAAGSVQRVDLTGTLPEGVVDAAITARSNGTEVVVSAGTTITADEPGSTATLVQLGAPAPDRAWTVAGSSAAGRAERLRLVNPTGAAASVDVAVLVGVSSLEPADLQAIELEPGTAIDVDLTEVLDGAGSWTAFVRASGSDIVVGRVGARASGAEGTLRAVATVGAPSASWQVRGSGLVAAQREDLARTLRTRDGVRPLGPLDGFEEELLPGPPIEPEPGTTPPGEAPPPDVGDVTIDEDAEQDDEVGDDEPVEDADDA